MPDSSAHVSHAERAGVHVFRYTGRVTYTAAPAIQRFLDDLLTDGGISGLIFDLTQAESLDSTNLGLLARLNERVQDATGAPSLIISSNPDITDVLFSMGFDQSFRILSDAEAPPNSAPGRDIDLAPSSPAELHETMLEAHRALVRLSHAGRLQFQEVVTCLESDAPAR